jgi:hypothetical protein
MQESVGVHVSGQSPPTNEIADQKRLAELDRERAHVLAVLEQLKRRAVAEVQPTTTCQMAVAVASSTAKSNAEKVALFRSLFRGRDDVFPRRWETQRLASPAMLQHATTNGFAASVRSPGSSAAAARTRHSCPFPRKW